MKLPQMESDFAFPLAVGPTLIRAPLWVASLAEPTKSIPSMVTLLAFTASPSAPDPTLAPSTTTRTTALSPAANWLELAADPLCEYPLIVMPSAVIAGKAELRTMSQHWLFGMLKSMVSPLLSALARLIAHRRVTKVDVHDSESAG